MRWGIHTKGTNMNRVLSKILAIGFAIAAGLAVTSMYAEAGGEDNSAALAKALSEASVTLDQGLSASESKGKPISGKFEIEDGALQLSVYTMNGDQFAEVIVDHKSGSIKKSEPITEGDDLKAAKEQGEAMAKAKRSLRGGGRERRQGQQRFSRHKRRADARCRPTVGLRHSGERRRDEESHRKLGLTSAQDRRR